MHLKELIANHAWDHSPKPVGTGLFADTVNLHPLPPLGSILVGEIVYNLRAACDYLIYELAILDSGQVQEGTQFLIEDHPKGWKRWDSTRLKGLSPKHKVIIARMQPFEGCDWTRVLRDVSDPDKHRTLKIARLSDLILDVATINADADWNLPQFVNMSAKLSFQVTFDDGPPVIETLEILQLKVAEVLDMFDPEFK